VVDISFKMILCLVFHASPEYVILHVDPSWLFVKFNLLFSYSVPNMIVEKNVFLSQTKFLLVISPVFILMNVIK
jgi:hypothetical protein